MKCEKCEKGHDGSFGSGRFCSRSCANGRKHSIETKNKIKKSMKKRPSGFVDEEHRRKFIEAGREAAKKWREERKKEIDKKPFSELGPTNRRQRVLEEQGEKCNRCGIHDWLDEPITLEIEHKDGNHHNNERSNLEALCPNCHSQTDTFRGKNKGKRQPMRTDDEIFDAYVTMGNIRQALLSLGMAGKGNNYNRVKKIIEERITGA